MRAHSEARAQFENEERKPHFESPFGYPPHPVLTERELEVRKRINQEAIKSTLDSQVHNKVQRARNLKQQDQHAFNLQVTLGHGDEDREQLKLREKELSYKNQVSSVWERELKVAELKGKLQHELGVALNDDKIKILMSKTVKESGSSIKPRYQPTAAALLEPLSTVKEAGTLPVTPDRKLDNMFNSERSSTHASTKQTGSDHLIRLQQKIIEKEGVRVKRRLKNNSDSISTVSSTDEYAQIIKKKALQ